MRCEASKGTGLCTLSTLCGSTPQPMVVASPPSDLKYEGGGDGVNVLCRVDTDQIRGMGI